ncbi:MAG: PRD domain-containing protein [Clostridium sp.]
MEYSLTQTPSLPAASLSENSRSLIDRISQQILQQSLVFLDANKASSSLMVVLLNILKRLKLNYSDEITIRFIIHGAFVIERAVRSDPLPNKRTREIINSHADIYNTISEELDALNNIFNITISKAEIATITQIFLEYM